MNEENIVPVEQESNTDDRVNELEVLKARLAEALERNQAQQAKNNELLNETKAAKEEKRRQAEEADKIKQEQLKIAEKNGEFEKLLQHEREEKEKYKENLTKYQKQLKEQAISLTAEKMALELSGRDLSKAEPLKDLIAISLAKMADDVGNVDEDVLASLKKQFETDKKYSIFLPSNQSVGGGAAGNTKPNSAVHNNESLSPIDRINKARNITTN